MPNILNKALFILLLQLVFSASIFGQKTINEYVFEGKKYLENGKYYAAVESFEKALNFDTTNSEISYLYAKSLCKTLNYCKSVKWYQATLANGDTTKFPLAIYELSMALKNCGNYDEALINLKKSLVLTAQNKELSQIYDKILHEITSVEFAINHVNDSIKYFIQQLPTSINTTNSEFNPVPLPGGKLIFSSYRTLYSDTFSNIFSTFYTSNIMESKSSTLGWTQAVPFENRINSNKWFTANISFGNNYKTAYFTRCYDDNGRIGRCMIYNSDKKNGKWSTPEKLPEYINQDNYSSTQPFFVEGSDFDILYFVSNMPGGYGGMDIWYCILKDGKFQTPSNLGNVINTVGNEITPNYNINSGQLYFSSDWHESFGGYDIFVSNGGMNQWTKPVNMGIPINSENNDLYYTPIANSTDAYLSSNRIGSYSQQGTDYCCSDIYLVTSEKTTPENPVIDTIPIPKIITVEQKIKKLLPITLYFDNDIPDPNTTSDTTSTNYKDLLDTYILQKEIYQTKYSAGLTGQERLDAIDTISAFFDNYVLEGFDKLSDFVKLLKQELDSGKTVSIVVKGYASPLNTPEYNYQLSKRRIASLINYISIVDNGYFLPYLTGNDSLTKHLQIFEDPRGAKNAATYVSGNPNDKRNSVYSKAAAIERRIQIIMYSSGDSIINQEAIPKLIVTKLISHEGPIRKGEFIKGSFKISNSGASELNIKDFEANSEYIQFQPERIKIKPNETAKVYYLIKSEYFKNGDNEIIIKPNSNSAEKTEIKITFILGEKI